MGLDCHRVVRYNGPVGLRYMCYRGSKSVQRLGVRARTWEGEEDMIGFLLVCCCLACFDDDFGALPPRFSDHLAANLASCYRMYVLRNT